LYGLSPCGREPVSKILIWLGPFVDEIKAIIFERKSQEVRSLCHVIVVEFSLGGLMLAIMKNQQADPRWQFQDLRHLLCVLSVFKDQKQSY
jgi:hypothetical protein